MFEERCQDLEYLPIYYSWNRHCGGNWVEFYSRTFQFAGAVSLGLIGAGMLASTGPIGMTLGAGFLAKSINDLYESSTGKEGYARTAIGSPAYDAIDAALIVYSFYISVPKINYLGNKARDFFVRDPKSYEPAYMQFSTFEGVYFALSTGSTVRSDYERYKSIVEVELVWDKHLSELDNNDQ